MESKKACMKATEELYENIELAESFRSMLRAFNETCKAEDLCNIDMHDETLKFLGDLKESKANNTTAAPVVKVSGSGAAHFGGGFHEHATFKRYATACDDAGGDLICIDATANLEGEAGASFREDGTGVDTDVHVKLTSYPVCLTKECEGEEMVTTLENTAKNAFLKSPKIEKELTTHIESIVKAASVKQVCALSGLDKCEMIVERQACGLAKSAGATTRDRSTTLIVLTIALGFLSVVVL